LTAFISPYREDRASAREIIGEGQFAEVFVDAPVEVCEARDPKGLYRRARSGEISEFTGVSAPYEPPDTPQIHLRTASQNVEECVETILRYLQENGFLENG
jgi:adenylylsulfate kinase-like enzyme